MAHTAKYNKSLPISLFALIALITSIQSMANELDWKPYNLEVVTQHIIPSYQQLDDSAHTLTIAAKNLCETPNEKQLIAAQHTFENTMDAWQLIQHVSFGPIEYDMRSHSLQFWPDKKNHIGKQLAKLMKASDPKQLTPKQFSSASVAIKGLPAIERILFSPDPLNEIKTNPFRCEILRTISQNVSRISASLHREWKESMLPQFNDSQQVDGYFEDDIDAATALLKTLVEPLEIIIDLKLKRPLGSEFGKQKYKRLESWRSERSLRNIQYNIRSTRRMLLGSEGMTGLAPMLNKEVLASLLGQLKTVETSLKSVDLPLEQAINNAEGNAQTRKLVTSISNLHNGLEKAIASLGIHLGFNSRDGD